MSRRKQKLPTPQGKGAGQTATVSIPIGPTYNRFDLYMQAAAANGAAVDVVPADWVNYIDDIRLLVDGNVRIEATADFFVKRANFFGKPPVDGILPIYLAMPWARLPLGEDQTAYGTASGMTSFTLEIDIKPNIVLGALDVYADQSPPQAFGPHLRIQRFAKSFSAIGIDEVADIPRGNFVLLNADIDDPNIGSIEILADGRGQHTSILPVRKMAAVVSERVFQPGFTHLDFMAENRVNDAFPMALQDFRMKLDFTVAPNAYNIYITSLQGAAAAA